MAQVVPKILVDFERYQKLLADLKVAKEPKTPTPPPVSSVEQAQDSENDVAATIARRAETADAYNAPLTLSAGPSGEETSSARPDEPKKDFAEDLEKAMKKAPSSLRKKADMCLSALLKVEDLRLTDGVLYVKKRKILPLSTLLKIYQEPFSLSAEVSLMARIKTRIKSFSYAPTLPELWYKL